MTNLLMTIKVKIRDKQDTFFPLQNEALYFFITVEVLTKTSSSQLKFGNKNKAKNFKLMALTKIGFNQTLENFDLKDIKAS